MGTVLPNQRDSVVVSNVVVMPTVPALPATWQAGIHGLLNALQMLMPGSWSWEDALAIRTNMSVGPQYAVTMSDMQALLSAVQVTGRIEPVHGLWGKDDIGLSDLLVHTLKVIRHDGEGDSTAGLPSSLMPTTYSRL